MVYYFNKVLSTFIALGTSFSRGVPFLAVSWTQRFFFSAGRFFGRVRVARASSPGSSLVSHANFLSPQFLSIASHLFLGLKFRVLGLRTSSLPRFTWSGEPSKSARSVGIVSLALILIGIEGRVDSLVPLGWLPTCAASERKLQSDEGGSEESIFSPNDLLTEGLHLLRKTEAGKDLLKKAFVLWKAQDDLEFFKQIHWSDSSRTDTILTRELDPFTGKEQRSRTLVLYLKKDQTLKDTVLDLAHELTHATSAPVYDPYNPALTAAEYLKLAIEASGGEVDAVMGECHVGLGLARSEEELPERCKRFTKRSSDGAITLQKEQILKGFYRVGKWKQEVEEKLGADVKAFPELSSEDPVLYSSTGHSPYPVALLREFSEITETACKNSLKRKASFISSFAAWRDPSSSLKNDVDQFIKIRCRENRTLESESLHSHSHSQ